MKTLLGALGASHECVGNLLEDIESELQAGNADNAGILKLLQQNRTMVRQQIEKALEIITDAWRHRIDPFAYLRDVYTRLPAMSESDLDSLLPDRWIQEHPEHLIEERVHEAQQRAQRTRARCAQRRRLAQAKHRK